ncbi:hypothetical protein NEUTE1DRAFT_116531 [Neurospora tetrasperma FGSC 2508]|uniref:Uncharacterized protein n=1 Tax=Neurospora tetrasperma (strain FGSC 2508 / ATCC MYA-4615 / P0657) TaxID=510951 RepID=F8MGR6_NEUT8|nr:uncharacterized protein NEUTE1DRAFT_116531 [Neurospora tetrasperma FGSC 2508]EGO59485.1 hypothetical protein NEUTE1DRAFT_116531 [Neurospora tetrasperma FGSC 2508]EGZ73610.1 hypothetical protein NEUTE2DRAFT_144226 [Neurospora tetrasperma FGSC 2509]
MPSCDWPRASGPLTGGSDTGPEQPAAYPSMIHMKHDPSSIFPSQSLLNLSPIGGAELR